MDNAEGDQVEARYDHWNAVHQRIRAQSPVQKGDLLKINEVDAFVSRETRAAAARRDRDQHPLVIARERSLVVTRAPAGAVKR